MISQASLELQEVQLEIDHLGISNDGYTQEVVAHAKINSLFFNRPKLLSNKAHIRWLEHGDQDSRIFHALLSRCRALGGCRLCALVRS